jgi:GT2 family glycosyltransferase
MSEMTPRLRVSVLICTAGRPELLDRAIMRLAAGEERLDQLVVVNGGDDRANEVVERHAPSFDQVVLLQYENRNLAASRNIGLPECDGDVIAMTDDDAVVALDWIRLMRQAHTDDAAAGAVGGPVHGASSDRFLSRVADEVVFPAFAEKRRVRTLPGVNVSYKRSVVEQVGTFDETLFRGEDVDFNWRMIRLGYHLWYDPAVRVEHEHRATFLGLLQQQWMYGRAYVLVRRKWQDMYCVYPRQLRTVRDWAKAFYCVAAVIFHPALTSRRMRHVRDGMTAYPLLVLHHATWKLGMLRQVLAGKNPANSGSESQPVDRVTLRRRWHKGIVVEDRTGVSQRQRSVRLST